MAGGGGGKNGGNGKGHKQATPEQIAELRKLLSGLEATNATVLRYRWLTDDRMLHRFITARNGNVEVALKMLLEHLVSSVVVDVCVCVCVFLISIVRATRLTNEQASACSGGKHAQTCS